MILKQGLLSMFVNVETPESSYTGCTSLMSVFRLYWSDMCHLFTESKHSKRPVCQSALLTHEQKHSTEAKERESLSLKTDGPIEGRI